MPASSRPTSTTLSRRSTGERFEIVYTGRGALNWLPDLRRWAQLVSSLLAADGFLYLAEFHPFTDVFADDDLTIDLDYFHDPAGLRISDDGGTYADLDAETTNNSTHEWSHPISEVIEAILAAGLQLELFHEQDHTLFRRWPDLIADPDGSYRRPEGMPRLPLMYSLRARRESELPA